MTFVTVGCLIASIGDAIRGRAAERTAASVSTMDRHRRLATLVCMLSLWLQMMAPALASSMPRHAPDPFSVICHAASAGGQDHRKAPVPPHAPACDHCLLCHAVAGGMPPDGRPVFTRLDHPVSSPLRWVVDQTVVPANDVSRHAKPRGPPSLV